MRIRLASLLKPPPFAEAEKNHLAGILNGILLILLGMSVIIVPLGLIFNRHSLVATLLIGAFFFVLAAWLLRQGCINQASLVTLIVLIVAATYLAYTRQGVFDRALLIFPIILIIASLISERRLFRLIVVLSVAVPGLLVWAEFNGSISRQFIEDVSPFDFVAVATIFLVTAVLMRILTRSWQQSLALVRQNEVALLESNQQLERQKLALQKSEEDARQFQETLQALHEVSISLGQIEMMDDLYYQAVHQGLARLGFERLGLLLLDSETNEMVGTYGTDANGQITDERTYRRPLSPESSLWALLKEQKRINVIEDAELYLSGERVGQGWRATSALWDGQAGIGWLSADNLLTGQRPKTFQAEVLYLYSNTLGSLISRKRAEITLKQNEAAIRAYARELERSNDELQQFAYISSHDLQEPLRKIQTFGDRLKQRHADVLDERGLDYLRRMQEAADRMQTLIQDLLSLSRVGTHTRPFAPVDLNVILTQVLADLETHLEATGAQVQLAELPVIEADETQMRQLFQNLLSNALKFRRPQIPPAITLTYEAIADASVGRDCYRLAVQDNGIGFDEKYSERIFGMFQRLHGRSEYEGTGVGLAICRRIVERHHGRITAQSSPGQGSTFIVTLPCQQPKESSGNHVIG